jgi:hypothetical protein
MAYAAGTARAVWTATALNRLPDQLVAKTSKVRHYALHMDHLEGTKQQNLYRKSIGVQELYLGTMTEATDWVQAGFNT